MTKDFLVRRTPTTKKTFVQRTFDIKRLGQNNLDGLAQRNKYPWVHGQEILLLKRYSLINQTFEPLLTMGFGSFVWAPAVLTQPIDSNQTNLPKLGLWWKTARRWKCLNLTPGFESTISHWIQSTPPSQSASQPGELITFSSVILTGKNRASDVIGALPFSPLAIS